MTGPEHQHLRMVERPVDLGTEGKYLATVAGDATEIEDETWAFNTYLAVTFAALTVGLLLTTIFQVRFGLAPLKRISNSLANIRSGQAERLEGEFPEEIAPLARETNALLDANRAIVERSRTHVGNLAHAIKTPLSVIVNEAGTHRGEPFADKVLEQADVMRDQVTHHLERARIAARVTVIGTVTEVAPVIEALARTMEKIHRDRDILIECEIQAGAKFRGERQDFEEMAGNLVDNACKWASQKVFIEVLQELTPGGALDPTLRIVVDDDGPGLSPEQRTQVARRGQRLDETKPGSGLGLSIVTDLAALYGGSLTLGAAPIGGLRAELVLPGCELAALSPHSSVPTAASRTIFVRCAWGRRDALSKTAIFSAPRWRSAGVRPTAARGKLRNRARRGQRCADRVGHRRRNRRARGCGHGGRGHRRPDRQPDRRVDGRTGPPVCLRGGDERPGSRCARRAGGLAQSGDRPVWQHRAGAGLYQTRHALPRFQPHGLHQRPADR